MTAAILIYAALTFLLGAIPFSLLVGRFGLGVDIRTLGDGNPGATNVYRAGGASWFALAAGLDGYKALIPVNIAFWILNIEGWGMVLIGIAPLLGHTFSPFLGFQGGKSVASSFGMWMGLTVWEIPTFLGMFLGYWYKSLTIDGWAVMLTMFSLLLYLLLARPYPEFLGIWAGNALIFAYSHRHDLRQLPGIKRWLPFLPKAAPETATAS